MPTCHDIYDMASAFHDGDLSVQAHEAFRRHLELCRSCHDFYRSFETTIQRARDVLLVEPPAELAEEMVRRVREARSESA